MDLLINKFNNLHIQETIRPDQIDDLIDGLVNLKVSVTDKKYSIIDWCIRELLAKKQCCSEMITSFVPKYVY